MTLIHLLLLVLVSGIVIMAVMLVKKIRDLRMPPEESDDQLSARVHELIQESATKDASAGQDNKLEFDE